MRGRSAIALVFLCSLSISIDVLAQGCPPPKNIPVGNCAPKAGTAVPFGGDGGSLRIRKSVYDLTSAEIAELQNAFKALRALPASDPRSWMAQANVHCWNCAGDASTAPDVHGTWAFMPWHRVYLYTLEKILGELVGNPNLAIPYWDWNTTDTPGCTGHLKIPPQYNGTKGSTNPLWDCYRQATATTVMSASSVGASTVNTILTDNDTFSLFFGSATDSAALWPGPHGYVHLWVGNPQRLNIPKQDMGVLETAARDPLFWAHHANIDRLWDVWIDQWGEPDYPDDFLEQSWTFWNQNQQLVTMTAADAANRTARLAYQYAAPACTSPTAARTTATAHAHAETPSLRAAASDTIRLTPQPQTITASATPPRRKFNIAGMTGTRVVLNLDRITVPADQAAVLRVYVNHPNATAATGTDHPAFVKELYIVPSRTPGEGGGGRHQHPMNINIVLPDDHAEAVESARGQVQVTIVPVTGNEEETLEAAPEALDIQLKRPYITVE